MDVKKILIVAALALPFSIAHAEQTDVCSKVPGHWQGIFSYKNAGDCQRTNGCTHSVIADLSYVGSTQYHVYLQPEVGQGGHFNIQCADGKITADVFPGSRVSLNCDGMHPCHVQYDDQRLIATLVKM